MLSNAQKSAPTPSRPSAGSVAFGGVTEGKSPSTRLRWVSICSAKWAMRSRRALVRPVSASGKGKVSKQQGFVVAWPIFQCAPRGECPVDVYLAGKYAKGVGIVQGDGDEHVVRQDAGVQKLEGAVFGGFDRGDIAWQACELFAHFLPWLAM